VLGRWANPRQPGRMYVDPVFGSVGLGVWLHNCMRAARGHRDAKAQKDAEALMPQIGKVIRRLLQPGDGAA